VNDTIKAGLLAIAVLAWCGAAQAADDPADTLTGDWGGLRTDLRDRGVDFQFGYTSETASNVRGGVKHTTRYTDQWAFGTTLDLDKLVGLHHAQFQATITDRNGRNLSSDAGLNNLQQVQEVFGRGQTWRITQFWYDQKYFDDTFDWKVGRMTVGEDFASFSCGFMNLTFCGAQPGNIVGDYWFNWPVSQWATRGKVALSGFGYVQLGAYEVNPSYLTRRHAFSLDDPGGATGALIPLELGWLPAVGDAKLPGSYKFGVWYDTSRANDVFENTQGQVLALGGGQPRGRDGRYGTYVNFLQQVTRPSSTEPDRGLSLFFNATFADRRTATLDSQIAVGMTYTGLFDARPHDELGFAIGRTHVNDRVKTAQELQNDAGVPVGIQRSEYATELYYAVQVTSWAVVWPNLQYIHQPGGVSQNTDDVVLGLKLTVRM
jgi:porin